MPQFLVFALGFLAQGFFSVRILVQWVLSERQRRIVSPNAFWICSLAGSILLFVYGWLRNDFSIILGQFISYYVYIWNLNAKGVWPQWPRWVRGFILLLPAVAAIAVANDAYGFFQRFLRNEHIPLWLLVFGSAGQILFTLRFVYQWVYSYRRHASILPIGFWLISLIGSGIIVSYGLFRLDPVLILGQSVGFVAYVRNIIIGLKRK